MADPYSLESVRRVLNTHRAQLTERFSAAGTGIGRPDPSGPYVITVYVRDSVAVPAEQLTVDDVPVTFEVTRGFRFT